jgi:hypothetical protein
MHAALGFSAVSLVTIAMVAFSSLQKQRVGGNSPLALSIGFAVILPTFYIPLLPFSAAILVDLFIAGLADGLSILLLILSSRLIRREKNASITVYIRVWEVTQRTSFLLFNCPLNKKRGECG